ncbi:MAG TPA: hypothetical protein PLR74_14280 [Agriterribacter sp.]|nr:hypothetical protein [Agriterribacter sp.]
MKNLINNYRTAAFLMAVLFTVSFTAPAFAIDDKNKPGLQLQHIGNIKEQPVFQLSFNGAEEQEFSVVVLDNENTVLYKDILKGSNFVKKFLLNTEELGNANVRFEITNRKTSKTTTYDINRNTRYIQDLVVNKRN